MNHATENITDVMLNDTPFLAGRSRTTVFFYVRFCDRFNILFIPPIILISYSQVYQVYMPPFQNIRPQYMAIQLFVIHKTSQVPFLDTHIEAFFLLLQSEFL